MYRIFMNETRSRVHLKPCNTRSNLLSTPNTLLSPNNLILHDASEFHVAS